MIEGKLYNQQASLSKDIKLIFNDKTISLVDGDKVYTHHIDTITVSDRLANMPRSIYFDDGSVCECKNNDVIDNFLKNNNKVQNSQILHIFEHKLKYFIAALIITVASLYAFSAYALPGAAKLAANNIPSNIVYSLGDEVLQTLDKTLFAPTRIDANKQQELHKYFDFYIQKLHDTKHIKVYFRSSDIGANALALPDGAIVFTDDLIKTAQNKEQLLAILFHEIGHIQNRHALRGILQNSAFYLMITLITGDVSSTASFITALPTFFVESGYSRMMEIEADDYAYKMLKHHKISTNHFAQILRLLSKDIDEEDETMIQYLSSHPLTKERIARFQSID